MPEMGTNLKSRVRQLRVKYLTQVNKAARPLVGFKPATLGLRVGRSTTEPWNRTEIIYSIPAEHKGPFFPKESMDMYIMLFTKIL